MSYSNGFEIIHADWPAYPNGHGAKVALEALALFPTSTRFVKIDEIDDCFLLLVTGEGCPSLRSGESAYDEKLFHIAIWADDLVDLAKNKLVTLPLLTGYECLKLSMQAHPDWLGKLPAETAEFEEELELYFAAEGFSISEDGGQRLDRGSFEESDFHPEILARSEKLLSIGYYDTAVRDATVLLETRLRRSLESSKFGLNLVEEFFCHARETQGESAFLKCLRCELRTVFKFVRNPFAHQTHEISRNQSLSLLSRISAIYFKLDSLGF